MHQKKKSEKSILENEANKVAKRSRQTWKGKRLKKKKKRYRHRKNAQSLPRP